jgi:sensor histidine kinase YesM
MTRKGIMFYIWMAVIVSIVIALFIHLNALLVNLIPPHGRGRMGGRGEHVLLNMTVTALVSFCTFMLNYYFVRPLQTLSRTSFKEIVFALVVTLISVTILSDVFFALLHGGNRFKLFHFDTLSTIRDLVISIVILCGIFFIKMIADRQLFILENERLTRENLQSRYESLKNQLSPHFLFNSLSALKSLIAENPAISQTYVDHLSHVLRHSLNGNKNKTVSLADELEVVDSYVFLIKMRYESSISIERNVDNTYLQHRLPPLALQTLVENAVKHNVISKRYPLMIRIFTGTDKIIVANSIREKYSSEEGTGIGLPNLASQYKLLVGQDIQILKTENEFRVELPLLKPVGNESIDR